MMREEPRQLEEESFRQFKHKVATWEKQGVFDRIAAKIDRALEETDKSGLKDGKWKALNKRPSSPSREEARHVR